MIDLKVNERENGHSALYIWIFSIWDSSKISKILCPGNNSRPSMYHPVNNPLGQIFKIGEIVELAGKTLKVVFQINKCN